MVTVFSPPGNSLFQSYFPILKGNPRCGLHMISAPTSPAFTMTTETLRAAF